MSQYLPLHKNGLILKDLGNEFLIYSAERKEIHVINPTGRLIWDLCDGKHSVVEMEIELRAQFSVPSERDVTTDIQTTLDAFQKKGLLQNTSELA